MPSAGAFWSYVHADDDADGGRVTQLAQDLSDQYEMITGDPIDLFLDQASIKWGDDWRDMVDSALASIAFFVAVITPRYFRSAECRRELQLFARQAEKIGVRDLILPLVYVDVPELHESSPTDDSVSLVKSFQWEDWRHLRFKERASEEYRTAVAKLAQRLADANRTVVAASVPPAVAAAPTPSSGGPGALPAGGDDDEDAPGELDLMAVAEEAIPQWNETITEVGSVIEEMGSIAEEAGAEMERGDRAGKGFAARLTAARKFAAKLTPKADRIAELANDFTTHLYNVDGGLRAMIASVPDQVEGDDEARRHVCVFFQTITSLVETSRESMLSFQGLAESIAPVEALSRHVRPPLRTIRSGLTVMIEGQSVMDEWVRLIEASPVRCDDLFT